MLASALKEGKHFLCLCALLVLSARVPLKQERSAEELIQSLAWNPVEIAVVLRDGSISEVPVNQLVPGDVVHISQVSEGLCILTIQHIVETFALG